MLKKRMLLVSLLFAVGTMTACSSTATQRIEKNVHTPQKALAENITKVNTVKKETYSSTEETETQRTQPAKEDYKAPVDTSRQIINQWNIGEYDPDAVIATFYADGELKITGKGPANAYGDNLGSHAFLNIPWLRDESIRNAITKVSMDETVIPNFMSSWFFHCKNLTDISDLHLYQGTGLHGDGIYNMNHIFNGCEKLTDISSFVVPDTVDSLEWAFCRTGIKTIPSTFKLNGVAYAEGLFACSALESAENFVVPGNVKNADVMFWDCPNLKNVNGLTIESGVDSAFRFLGSSRAAEGTITIKSNLKEYDWFFENASGNGTGLVVNYTSDSQSIIDKVIKTANQYNDEGEMIIAGKVNKGTMVQ